MKRKVKILVIFLAISVVVGIIFFSQKNIVSIATSEDICRYIAQSNQTFNCDYTCEGTLIGNSWDVSYWCRGPEHFPLGQGYELKVNRYTGYVSIGAMTN